MQFGVGICSHLNKAIISRNGHEGSYLRFYSVSLPESSYSRTKVVPITSGFMPIKDVWNTALFLVCIKHM